MRLINADMFIDLVNMEDNIYFFIIESPTLFYNIVKGLKDQIDGLDGNFVLSDNNVPLEIKDSLHLILDPISLDFKDKKIVTKIQELLINQAIDEAHFDETSQLIKNLEKYANNLGFDFDGEVSNKELITPSKLIKFLKFELDYSYDTFEEMILEYILTVNRYLGIDVFGFVNLFDFLETNQIERLIKEIKNNHISVFFLESHDLSIIINGFTKIIIDSDFCQI